MGTSRDTQSSEDIDEERHEQRLPFGLIDDNYAPQSQDMHHQTPEPSVPVDVAGVVVVGDSIIGVA